MATRPEPYLSPQEYLDLERAATYKSEYFDGEIFAIRGASRPHNLIVTNLISELSIQLRGRPCEVYPSDMRVKVSPTGLYTYPDVVVVCGTPEFEDAHIDTLLNPTVLFEVFSDSTEGYAIPHQVREGRKFEHYRQLASLQEYVLVAQAQYHVEHYVRQADHRWLLAAETNEPAGSSCRRPRRAAHRRRLCDRRATDVPAGERSERTTNPQAYNSTAT